MVDKIIIKSHFPFLTGIRALAAFLVYFHHFRPNLLSETLDRIFLEFHVGVPFFFVLSGFLICFTYYGSIDDISKNGYIKYAISRFSRIYPMYFIVTLITFLVKNDTNYFNWLLNFTLLKGFFDNYKFSGIAQGWTLSVELFFYLLAPFLFYVIKKYKIIFVQSVFFLLIGVLLVVFLKRYSLTIGGFFGNFSFMFLCTFFGRSFEFFCGIKLALLIKNGYLYQFKRLTYFSIICIVGIVLLMSFVPVIYSYKNLLNSVEHPLGIFLNNFCLPIAIGLFFYSLIVQDSLIRRILSSNVSVLLGNSSYIFYLIHLGVINLFIKSYISSNNLVIFLALILLSIISFKYVEEPLNRCIKKFLIQKVNKS